MCILLCYQLQWNWLMCANWNICRLCVYDWICRGTESCSRPQDCELQSTVRRIRKDNSKKIWLWLFLPFSHQNCSLKVFHDHQWVLPVAYGDHQYQQACIPNTKDTTKILFQQLCKCLFFRESQDWSLIESGGTWDPLLQCLYKTNISSNNKIWRNYKRLKITVCMC